MSEPLDMAFPSSLPLGCSDANGVAFGLTKRELFAAMAMQGHLANAANIGKFAEIAVDAVYQADALIFALSSQGRETAHHD